jgi:hypothetical protein
MRLNPKKSGADQKFPSALYSTGVRGKERDFHQKIIQTTKSLSSLLNRYKQVTLAESSEAELHFDISIV